MKNYVMFSLNKLLANAIFAMLYNVAQWFKDKFKIEEGIKVYEDVICYGNVLALLFLVFCFVLDISWFDYVCFMKHLIGLQVLWLDGSSTNELSNLKSSRQKDIN